MAGLTITVEDEGAVAVATLAGVVDSATVSDFQQKLAPLLKRKPANLILECSGLSYLNSRAIGLLTHYHREAMRNMGRLVYVGLQDSVLKTFDIYRVRDTFCVEDNVEDARASIV